MAENEEQGERMPRRPHRRVTTAPAPGSDPAPALPARQSAPEETSEHSNSNDERLKRDVPPHW